MEKTCAKCGHTHTIEKIDTHDECPRCGIIYAKTQATEDKIEKGEKPDVDEQNEIQEALHPYNRRSSIFNFLVLGCVACLFLYFYIGRKTVQENEVTVIPLAGEQIESPEAGTIRNETSPDDYYDTREENNDIDADLIVNEEIINTASLKKNEDTDVTGTEKEAQLSGTQIDSVALPLERPQVATPGKGPVDYYLAESTISRGSEVSLDDHMSDRPFTVFYFYADW